MTRTSVLAALLFSLSFDLAAQQFKVVTIVESIVPMGVGRSRIIESTSVINSDAATTVRTDGKKSDQDDVDRSDLKVDNFNETKLLNFFSGVGINFQNIASNDALIMDKMNKYAADGWKLIHIASGVESAGQGDNQGIFITRMFFQKD
ncbi:MAG: hypothetical protein E6Q44_16580 [Flavobacteriales bacterium]|jgi:hypothetical protein|nr:MAG: hypothetical protein E6Q44_16580 [Flavobacteriales bacterium]